MKDTVVTGIGMTAETQLYYSRTFYHMCSLDVIMASVLKKIKALSVLGVGFNRRSDLRCYKVHKTSPPHATNILHAAQYQLFG